MVQNGAQGSIWEAPAEHLAHCGGVWGPWWSILGALVRHLGSFRALGGAFGSLGSDIGGLGGPFGLNRGAFGSILEALRVVWEALVDHLGSF